MYGDPAVVRRITGLKPSDLNFADDGELDAFLEARLLEISHLMLQDRRRTEQEVSDKGWVLSWDGIANRWCSEFMHFVMASRDSPIVKVDDFVVTSPTDNVPGPAVLKDLRRYGKNSPFEISVVPGRQMLEEFRP